jgi:hypothetical protein
MQRPSEGCTANSLVLVSLSDCTRVMRDIVLGVLCGATMGLFVAMVGDFF